MQCNKHDKSYQNSEFTATFHSNFNSFYIYYLYCDVLSWFFRNYTYLPYEINPYYGIKICIHMVSVNMRKNRYLITYSKIYKLSRYRILCQPLGHSLESLPYYRSSGNIVSQSRRHLFSYRLLRPCCFPLVPENYPYIAECPVDL